MPPGPTSHRPPCPDCAAAVGTNRFRCKTCHRFGGRVKRAVDRELRQRYPEQVKQATYITEPQVWSDMFPDTPWGQGQPATPHAARAGES